MKAWLETNKIWFETVAASLLSVMAIVVSVGQNRATSKQTELLALQTRVAEAQALPQFEIEMHPKLNEATGKFDDYFLIVNNRGGAVADFSANAAVFLRLETFGASGESAKVDVPVNGYFTASFPSASGTGQLISMVGYLNNAAVAKLSNALKELASKDGPGLAHLDAQIIVRLRYRDLLGRRREDYYEANFIGGGSRIADDIGRTRLAEWETSQPPELSTLNALDLLVRARPTKSAP